MSDPVVVTDDGPVRIVRMNRPEKKNALTLPMYLAMTAALRTADAAPAIRCVMFAGAPEAFCAGNDIADFVDAADSGLDPRVTEFLHALALSQKPLLAAVRGVAVGIGTTMLLHCDYVVAGTGATLSTPFVKLGVMPEAGSTLLAPLRLGYARAFSMLIMGRPLSAEAAREAGLVNEVVEPAAVETAALKAAHEIAALPARAVALGRRLMRGRLDDVIGRIDTEVVHFKELLQTDEARAAFAAFLARKR